VSTNVTAVFVAVAAATIICVTFAVPLKPARTLVNALGGTVMVTVAALTATVVTRTANRPRMYFFIVV
jgi:Trk-type K+ transport system membrane component